MPKRFSEVSACAPVSWQQKEQTNMAQSVDVTLCTCLHVLHIEDVTMLAIHPLQLSMVQMSMKACKQ